MKTHYHNNAFGHRTREKAMNEFFALGTSSWTQKRAEPLAPPSRIVPCVGARGALQRCPILRAGKQKYTPAEKEPRSNNHTLPANAKNS